MTSHSDPSEIRLRDGRILAFAEYGSPRGKPVIYCHGAPSSRFEAQLDMAATAALDVRVIAPDRPGMGRSDFQPGRQVVDWPSDILELATALKLEKFAVLGASAGAPYAAACAALIPDRVLAIGLVCGVAPLDAPEVLASVRRPMLMTWRLARFAPGLVRGWLGLVARGIQSGGTFWIDRVAASFPEPDRSLFRHSEYRDYFTALLCEAFRAGTRGPVWDIGLLARPWGIDLASINVPVLLWHGERE